MAFNLIQALGKIVVARYTRWRLNYSSGTSKGVQILLGLKYRELLDRREPLLKLEDTEFRVFSQNGEDGILLYIFSLIGHGNKKAVEICAGPGVESNTANLIINHGWHALLFDGDQRNVRIGRSFYARSRDTFFCPPTFRHAWIDTANVNALISGSGFEGEIDLLSIDMDGVDYWIWKAIECISPRVVILEYNEQLGFERVTVPYDPKFNRLKKDIRYWGGSLSAFCSLAKEKGYRLVGCNRQRLNAFFIRNDVGVGLIPEINFECCMGANKEDYPLLVELSKRFEFFRV